jgi:hypothetical protein
MTCKVVAESHARLRRWPTPRATIKRQAAINIVATSVDTTKDGYTSLPILRTKCGKELSENNPNKANDCKYSSVLKAFAADGLLL